MKPGVYDIRTDPNRSFVRISLEGYWSEETVVGYKAELSQAIAAMMARGAVHGEVLALVDARGLGAQAGNVIDRFKQDFSTREFKPKKLATLVSSALFKMQVRRIAIPDQMIFSDEAEAMLWLFGDDGQLGGTA